MISTKYKIVSITQVFNEIEKDNLVRFFKYLKPVVDEIVIYDDCSTDGSYEYALENTNHVIRGFKNDFSNEINHRDISEIPHPFISETMDLFSSMPIKEINKIYFIHLNHTNPALDKSSIPFKNIISKGFNVADLNMEFSL